MPYSFYSINVFFALNGLFFTGALTEPGTSSRHLFYKQAAPMGPSRGLKTLALGLTEQHPVSGNRQPVCNLQLFMDLLRSRISLQTQRWFLITDFITSKTSFMNAETILRSDLLDIVFERRNKAYGAYPLRKEYSRRLYAAIGIMLAFVLSLVALSLFKNDNVDVSTKGNILTISDTVTLTKVNPPLPEQPRPPAAIPQAATIKNVTPLIVQELDKTEMPPVEEMIGKIISNRTEAGPDAGNIVQPSPSQNTGEAKAPAPEKEPEPAIWDNPELMPEFPGGTAALLRFLGRNLRVPEDAVLPGQRVRVPVKFVVNKDGNLSDLSFPAQTDEAFKKEIMRVMAKMPKWKPGSQHGKTVAVYFTIPIIFETTDN
jgi:protein TonB